MAVCRNLTNGIYTTTHMGPITGLHPTTCTREVSNYPIRALSASNHPNRLDPLNHSFTMHSNGRIRCLPTLDTEMVKCESEQQYDSGKNSGASNGYEVSRTGGATGQGVRQIEQRIIELRLRWALRRIQQRLVHSYQRRCEMRLFVILRLQYLFRRRRSRIRAAVTIQRFIRPILRKHVVRHSH